MSTKDAPGQGWSSALSHGVQGILGPGSRAGHRQADQCGIGSDENFASVHSALDLAAAVHSDYLLWQQAVGSNQNQGIRDEGCCWIPGLCLETRGEG